jgi:flagellar hook assembly protein FlgD
VSLIVYNVMGQHVLTLFDGELPAGEQKFTWDGRTGDGRQAPSGVYFYRLSVQDRVYTGKMMMLR